MSWQVGVPGSHCPDKWHTLLELPISVNPVSHSKSTSAPYFVSFVADTVPLAGARGSLQSTKIDEYRHSIVTMSYILIIRFPSD